MEKTSLPLHFSPSSLACYQDCPRAYFYKYICKLSLPMDSVHLVFGSAVHKAIELFDGDVAKAKLVYKIEFDKKKLAEKEWPKYDELLPIGELIVQRYAEQNDFIKKLHAIAPIKETEIWLNATLENPLTGEKLSIPMKGRIDMLTEKDQIIDYKTSAKAYDVDSEEFKYQTKLYALGRWSLNKKIIPEVIYYVFVKNLKKLNSASPIQVIPLQFTLEELAETFEKTKNILIQIENKEFKPGRCKPFCDHKKIDMLLNPEIKVEPT